MVDLQVQPAPEQALGQAVAIEGADRVGNALEHLVDARLLLRPDVGAQAMERIFAPWSLHPGGAAKAAGAGHVAAGALRPAALRVAGPMHTTPWASKHLAGIQQLLVGPLELGEGSGPWAWSRLRGHSSHSAVSGASTAPLGGRLPSSSAADRGLGDLGRRRAAGNVVVHVHDLVERAHDVVQLGQVRLTAVLLEHELGPRLRLVDHGRCVLVVELEDLLARKLVGQPRNAAGARARTVGDQVAGSCGAGAGPSPPARWSGWRR